MQDSTESSASGAYRGPQLSWQRMDIEQRLGFEGGKYTDVNNWVALAIGVLMVVFFYASVLFCARGTSIGDMFLGRSYAAPAAEEEVAQGAEGETNKIALSSFMIPFFIVFLSCWSLGILFLKWMKLRLQRRALELEIVPAAHDFVLAPSTAPQVLARMYDFVDNPKHFLLLNRIDRALSNLSNIGRVSDVTEMLQSQAQNDEDQMQSSYAIVKGFIWGIPVLGFIGTVVGLSAAIGGFGDVLERTTDLNKIADHLKGITGGLSTAFETTLEGLVAALCIQLLLASLKKKEESFLDDAKEYCHAHVVSRLRLLHLDGAAAASEGFAE